MACYHTEKPSTAYSTKYVLLGRAAEVLSSGELFYGLVLESYAAMPFTLASKHRSSYSTVTLINVTNPSQ